MTRLQRLFSWIRGHVIVADSIITALLALFMFGLGNNIEFNPGLLYNYPAQVQMVWSIALLVPLITRRRWPQISALAFVVLVLLHRPMHADHRFFCDVHAVFGDSVRQPA